MKRLFALLLCLMMCVSLIPAAAAEDIEIIEIEPEDDEIITLVDPEEPADTAGAIPNAKPTITASPKSVTAYVGTTVEFTVEATGADSYQWYYRTSSSGSWSKSTASSATTMKLTVTAEAKRNGYQYRCKVTNDEGYVYSSAATLTVSKKPVITSQPESLTIVTGGTAKFTVEAEGATGYQWYWRANADDSWHKGTLSTATTKTLVYKNMSSVKDGYQFKCKVSNDEGYVYSAIATLTVSKKPVITLQPESLTIYVGGTAKFKVAADGATAYQWYWRANKDDSWHKGTLSSATTATLVYKNMSSAKNGYQFKCKVSSAEGYTYSKIATLTVSEKPIATKQPLSYTAGAGANVSFTVEAIGADSYQWQFRKSSSGSWSNSTAADAKTSTFSVTAESYRNGYQYRCKLINAKGTSYSQAATLTVSKNQCGNDLTWTLDSNGLLVISGTGDMRNYAYWDCISDDAGYGEVYDNPWVNYYVEEVVIENGVTRIGYGAFAELKNLKSVSIPDSVTKIEGAAFANCVQLTSLVIPDSVKTIRNEHFVHTWDMDGTIYGVFEGCSALTSVTLPKNIKYIERQSFKGCVSLTEISIPDSVTKIKAGAFCYCYSLTNVTIGKGVTSIGDDAFYECNSLPSITIPASVTNIGYNAFLRCSSLTAFTVESGNTVYSSKAGVLLSKDKTTIICCPGGKTGAYTIPDSVTSIGWCAFEHCRGLTSVTIGKAVTSIDVGAFYGCTSLADVYYKGTKTQWGKIDIGEYNDRLLSANIHYNA